MQHNRFIQIIQLSDIEHSIHRFICKAKDDIHSDAEYKMIRAFALAMQDYLEEDIRPVWLDLKQGYVVSDEYKEEHEDEQI